MHQGPGTKTRTTLQHDGPDHLGTVVDPRVFDKEFGYDGARLAPPEPAAGVNGLTLSDEQVRAAGVFVVVVHVVVVVVHAVIVSGGGWWLSVVGAGFWWWCGCGCRWSLVWWLFCFLFLVS